MPKFLILLSFVFATAAEANTYIVPDVSRNRRNPHRSGAAAGWNQRSLVGVERSSASGETDVGGVKDSESDETLLSGHLFYHVPVGLSAELVHEKLDEEDETVGFNTIETKTKTTSLNLGYVLPTVPGSVGLEYSNDDTNSGAIKKKTLGVSYSHKVGDIFVGGGVSSEKTTQTIGSDDDDSFFAGIGTIKGDGERPNLAAELILNWRNEEGIKVYTLAGQGLLNVGPWQPFGLIAVTDMTANVADQTAITVISGFDYEFGEFYVAPAVQYTYNEFTSDVIGNSHGYDLSLALEAGYRVTQFDVYLKLETANEEEKDTGAPLSETASNTFEIGGNWTF